MNYFMGEFARNTVEKKDSELKRWGKVAGYGALTGGVAGLGTNAYYANQINKLGIDDFKLKGGQKAGLMALGTAGGAVNGAKLGLLGYGAYRGGKALINKMRNRKKKSKSNFSTNLKLVNFAKKEKQVKKEPPTYGKSMLGWTRNGAIGGSIAGGLMGAPLGLVGAGIGAVNGGLGGAYAGANLGAYRNAARNIDKNYKDPKQKKTLRYARRGALAGTLLGNPGIGSVIGAGMANNESDRPKKKKRGNFSTGLRVANFTEKQKENKWGRNGAIIGGLMAASNIPKTMSDPQFRGLSGKQKVAGSLLGIGLNAGLGYGVGKISQKLAGKSNPKTVDPNRKKRNWKKIALNTAGVGLLGAGAIGLTRGVKANQLIGNPRGVLGVKGNASTKEIKDAYRNIAKRTHPDVAKGMDDQYKKATTAYQRLMGKDESYAKKLPILQKIRKNSLIGGTLTTGAGAGSLYLTNRKKKENR